MGEAFMMNHGSGGGGGSLNFSVKNYISEKAKPIAPRNENDIATITTVPYKNYIFGPVEPVNPVEGLVWFMTILGGEFEFSVTKKNPILIGLQTCRQYIQGKWRNIAAYIGIGGKWLQFSKSIEPYLYQSGVDDFDNRELTGGWAHSGTMSLTVNRDILRANTSASTETNGWAYTAKVIDLKDFKTMTFNVGAITKTVDYADRPGDCLIGVSATPNGNFIKKISAKSWSKNVITLDGIDKGCPTINCWTRNHTNQKSIIEINSIILE